MNVKQVKQWFPAKATVRNGLPWLSAALLLIGAGPMFAALVVANRAIDDGPNPGDVKLMADWDAWAFSPWFIACGVLGLIALLIRLVQYLARAFPWAVAERRSARQASVREPNRQTLG